MRRRCRDGSTVELGECLSDLRVDRVYVVTATGGPLEEQFAVALYSRKCAERVFAAIADDFDSGTDEP